MTTVASDCKGKPNVSDHAMVELGRCPHEVGGGTYTYLESGCTNCGAITQQPVMYACGTRKPAVRPTVDNCIAMKWKADRAAAGCSGTSADDS